MSPNLKRHESVEEIKEQGFYDEQFDACIDSVDQKAFIRDLKLRWRKSEELINSPRI